MGATAPVPYVLAAFFALFLSSVRDSRGYLRGIFFDKEMGNRVGSVNTLDCMRTWEVFFIVIRDI